MDRYTKASRGVVSFIENDWFRIIKLFRIRRNSIDDIVFVVALFLFYSLPKRTSIHNQVPAPPGLAEQEQFRCKKKTTERILISGRAKLAHGRRTRA